MKTENEKLRLFIDFFKHISGRCWPRISMSLASQVLVLPGGETSFHGCLREIEDRLRDATNNAAQKSAKPKARCRVSKLGYYPRRLSWARILWRGLGFLTNAYRVLRDRERAVKETSLGTSS